MQVEKALVSMGPAKNSTWKSRVSDARSMFYAVSFTHTHATHMSHINPAITTVIWLPSHSTHADGTHR